MPLTGYKFERDTSDGQKIVFGVRPEHIRINATAGPDVSPEYDAEIELVEPMGSDSLVWLTLEGQSLTARVESNLHFRPGDKVKIRFRVGLASIFDEVDGNRL